MFSLLFRNRWFALGWAALTLASVSTFVANDGGAEMIARSTKQIETQYKALAEPPVPALTVVTAPAVAPQLQAIPGMPGNPAYPKVGDVFIDPVTGRRVRVVRPGDEAPPSDAAAYSSSAASP